MYWFKVTYLIQIGLESLFTKVIKIIGLFNKDNNSKIINVRTYAYPWTTVAHGLSQSTHLLGTYTTNIKFKE